MKPTTSTKADSLTRKLKIAVLLALGVVGLYYTQVFLKPICFAILLAMLLLPFTKWLEDKKLNTYVAATISMLTVMLVMGSVTTLLWWQVSELAENTSNIEQTFDQWMRQSQRFMYRTFNLNYNEQNEILDEQQSAMASYIPTIMESIGSTMAKAVLVLVYAFMFLTHRGQIKRFIMRSTPNGDEEKTKSLITHANQVSVSYLVGLLKLIVAMTVLYSLAYWAIGIENPIFFAAVCGVLEMIPFVGNLLGSLITTIGAIAQDGNTEIIPFIFLVYFMVQFVQSYVLEPLIVGKEVNVNPLFSILALIVGELMWGLAGMVLAIPMLGIAKIYFDHTDSLQHYGKLIGTEASDDSEGPLSKLKSFFKRKTDIN